MSYVVFALKWRPKDFDQIIGQEHIVTSLKSSLEKDRVAHAYLFAGPRGVGKTSAARILAKALNCPDRKGVNPCGICPSCLDITAGRSLDVIEIDGASNRGIDEIRTLRENVKFSPTQGKYKVYIIDEVHQITPDGFNALLKTLEEPPPFVKFIFATTSPNKVMPTILSRCQRLDFRRISVLEIIAQLERICSAEKIDIDKKVLAAIARSSDGALRDAESILDQLISFSKGKVSLEDINAMLGLVEHDVLFEITDTIINRDARKALLLLNRIIDDGKDPGVFLQNLIEHFRNLMVAKVAQADAQLIDLPEEICRKLGQQSQGFSLEEIFNAFTVLAGAQEASKRLDSSRIPLEISLARLAHSKKAVGTGMTAPGGVAGATPAELQQSPARQQTRPDAAKHTPVEDQPLKSPFKKDTPAANASSGQSHTFAHKRKEVIQPLEEDKQAAVKAVSFEQVTQAWNSVISHLGKVKASAAHYLSEGSLVGMQNNLLTVSFPRSLSFHKESLESRDNKAIIEKNLSELLQSRIKINFVLSDKEPPRKQSGKEDPLVKSIMEAFEGKLIKEE